MPAVIPVFGLSLCLSISATLISGAAILLWWLARPAPALWKEKWAATPLSLPIALYMAWGLGVTLAMGSTDVRSALSAQTEFLIFFPVAYGLSREQTGSLAKWICIGSIVAGVLAVIQKAGGINYLPHLNEYHSPSFLEGLPDGLRKYLALRGDRAVGTRSHPLTFGESLIPAYFLLVSAAIARLEERKAEPKLWAGALLVAAGIFLAQGRAVWAGCAAGTLGMFCWVKGSAGKIVLPAGLGLALALVALSPSARGRVMSMISSQGGSAGDQQSKSVRLQLWSETMNMVRRHPVVGSGIDSVELHGTDPFLNTPRRWSETHNIFFQVLAERGLVGLGLFLWLLVCACRSLNDLPTVWKRAGHGFLAAMIIAGLTESWTNDKEIAFLFVVMIALAQPHRRPA